MERCYEWGNKSNKEVWHMRTMITQIIEKKIQVDVKSTLLNGHLNNPWVM